MEDKLTNASKEVLVHVVKLAQKSGMKGDKGDWKEFLKAYDTKFGASMSDPAKRGCDVLRAFIQTFKKDEDIRYFAKLMKSHENLEQLKRNLKSQDAVSPVQLLMNIPRSLSRALDDNLMHTRYIYELPAYLFNTHLVSLKRLIHLTLEHPQYSISYSFPSHEEDWFVTRLGKKSKGIPSNTLLAVDCEMVLCEDGSEALVKICVVDRDLKVVLDKFVKPSKEVDDYRTHITGVSSKDLDGVVCSVKDIQKALKKHLLLGAILVGHSLSNDLKAMKVDHAGVIDTSLIFKYGDGPSKRRPSLNDLCKTVLGYELREKGAPHNCIDDACAAMKLVLAKIEHGFNDVIPVTQDKVPESDHAKLLIHRIPLDLPKEELCQHISGDFTLEVQANKKGRGDKYSAFAIFKSPQEALNAYNFLQGGEEKDTVGRPQKPVSLQLKSGSPWVIYVRKMSCDELSAKRPCPTEASEGGTKKLKTEQHAEVSPVNSYVDHEKEIERLNNLVKHRDEEISSLHKIIAAITRKQAL